MWEEYVSLLLIAIYKLFTFNYSILYRVFVSWQIEEQQQISASCLTQINTSKSNREEGDEETHALRNS